MSTLRASLLLALTSLSTGCATTLAIRSMEPGAVPVGAAREIVLVGGEGRRSAREFVGQALVQQARSQGYFSVSDRSDEGLTVRIAGQHATVEGGPLELTSEQAGLWIDVLEWNAQRDVEEVRRQDPAGKEYVESTPIVRGNVLLAVTLFSSSGRALLSETEYEGWASTPPDAPREETIEAAARAALSSFLHDVTPRQVVQHVRLDDEDEGQQTILETAESGATAQAARDLETYLAAHPDSASAAYNLAVLREAMGDFQAALEMYDRALALGGKDYYARARAGCARRLAARDSLSQP